MKKWKNRLAELGEGIKVGISWRGGSKDSMKASRSIELISWESILQSDAHFVNLQYGDCTDEIEQIQQESGVHIYDWDDADPLTDLENFTAQIAALDLVISIDNSTVHFSGAVGTPTWVLLPDVPDWRWMLDRDDSPWYSEVRLFRQKMSGNWSDVISNVKSELERCRDK
jgi:ADP-heptose:LPS heptosyltransferase